MTGRDEVYDQGRDTAVEWAAPCPVEDPRPSGLPTDPYRRAGAVRALFTGGEGR